MNRAWTAFLGATLLAEVAGCASAPRPTPVVPVVAPAPPRVTTPAAPATTDDGLVPRWAPTLGPASARVTIVEFLDVADPQCELVAHSLGRVAEAHPIDVRLVFRHQPSPYRRGSVRGAITAAERFEGKSWLYRPPASRANREIFGSPQDHFWFDHNKQLSRFAGSWSRKPRPSPPPPPHTRPREASAKEERLLLQLRNSGLWEPEIPLPSPPRNPSPEADAAALRAQLDGSRFGEAIAADAEWGRAHDAAVAPTVFINGRRIAGAQPFDVFETAVRDEIGRLDALGGVTQDGGAGDASLKLWTPPAQIDRRSLVLTGAPARGAVDATIVIVEFADFDDPGSAAVQAAVREIEKEYAGRMRLVFKHQPMAFHRHALLAAEAAAAAAAQGRFWAMHDRLFERAGALDPAAIEAAAQAIGLDMERFHSDLDEGRHREAVERDAAEGFALGAEATPTFFINGARLVAPRKAFEFEQVIEVELTAGAATPGSGQQRRTSASPRN